MENYHVQWVNPLFLWPFSIAMLSYQRVITISYVILLTSELQWDGIAMGPTDPARAEHKSKKGISSSRRAVAGARRKSATQSFRPLGNNFMCKKLHVSKQVCITLTGKISFALTKDMVEK